MHAWVMVDALVRFQLIQLVLLDAGVRPVNVPVSRLIRVESEVEPTTRLLDYAILRLRGAKKKLLRFPLDLFAIFVLLFLLLIALLPPGLPLECLLLLAPFLELFCNFQMCVVRD